MKSIRTLSFPGNPSGSQAQARVTWILIPMIVGIGLLLAIVGCSGNGIGIGTGSHEPVESRDDSFSVGQSPRLVVDSSNGSITVNSAVGNTIRVQATLKRADKLEYEVRLDGDTVRIEARQPERTTGRSPSTEITVTAPVATRVELRSSNGMLEVRGMENSGVLTTSNGRIVIGDASGDFKVDTSNGEIDVSGYEGSIDLVTLPPKTVTQGSRVLRWNRALKEDSWFARDTQRNRS